MDPASQATPEEWSAVRREAWAELWQRGAAWQGLLDDGPEGREGDSRAQRTWVAALDSDAPGSTHVWKISRQRGKSFAALAYAASRCAVETGLIVRYAALTGKSAGAIVRPTMAQVLLDCPEELRPREDAQRGLWEWPNGAILVWAGTDNEQFDRLRGPRAHLLLFDESAFYADLERVESALLPQLQTTGGKALYLSSPPETQAHPFEARYQAARASGRSAFSTVHDNPRLGAEGVARLERQEAARLGLTVEALRASTYWRREYLAETVTEETRAAVPAWTEERSARLVRAVPRPPMFDGYVSGDWGVSPDPKASLWAWYHPAHGLHVERELEVRGATISQWAAEAKAIEREVWGVNRWDGTLLGIEDLRKRAEREVPEHLLRAAKSQAPRQPYLRVGDDDPEVLLELLTTYGYAVLPTKKHDKHLSVDVLNQWIVDERITIAPECVRLREQLATTLWNLRRTEWERTAKDHGDLVDCLVYLVRNVNVHRKLDTGQVTTLADFGAKRRAANGWARAFGGR